MVRLIIGQNSLWAKVIKSIYFPSGDFLFAASKREHPSWVWNSLLVGRALLVKGLRWQVGDGKSISIWGHKWVPALENFIPHPSLFRSTPVSMVADLINPVSKEWNREALSILFDFPVKQAILSISISKENAAII